MNKLAVNKLLVFGPFLREKKAFSGGIEIEHYSNQICLFTRQSIKNLEKNLCDDIKATPKNMKIC